MTGYLELGETHDAMEHFPSAFVYLRYAVLYRQFGDNPPDPTPDSYQEETRA